MNLINIDEQIQMIEKQTSLIGKIKRQKSIVEKSERIFLRDQEKLKKLLSEFENASSKKDNEVQE
ncbi:hypothetical protein BKH41_08505 [Helicobacter sp. 12S02232-10]|uniref:hypothetical protein n=1 Tax=Helicobacter sp. 12S02232-10 TaxID=1476197 RepID=UPI000BA5EF45|nr:hypothetical protein [Helicobacter sp. 12S02232-10]PAF46740.1 hypothetical protein BKH41_08505 [Helicobacter sp. 12S02232-10]